MNKQVTNQQVIDLINRAFDADGRLVNPKSKRNQAQARSFLDSGVNYSGRIVDGYDAHISLTIIAYPNKSI